MITHRKMYTEAQTRSWLQNRIHSFLPRIKKLKAPKYQNHTFSLEQLATDMERTLKELKERIAKRED